jgi:hypothetical protein
LILLATSTGVDRFGSAPQCRQLWEQRGRWLLI